MAQLKFTPARQAALLRKALELHEASTRAVELQAQLLDLCRNRRDDVRALLLAAARGDEAVLAKAKEHGIDGLRKLCATRWAAPQAALAAAVDTAKAKLALLDELEKEHD